MRLITTATLLLAAVIAGSAAAADLTIVVSDTQGTAGSIATPTSVSVDLGKFFGKAVTGEPLSLLELGDDDKPGAEPIPAQYDGDKLWWRMPPGPQKTRRFRISLADGPEPTDSQVRVDATGLYYDVVQGKAPVLRYSYGSVPVPQGTHKHFAEGESYERGDYISDLFGPSGQLLTEDYPDDHPHHRGVWWSWPVTRWGDQLADIWAVVRVHARPGSKKPRLTAGPVMAEIEAESLWKWEDKTSIVRENVLIRAFRSTEAGRYVDVRVCLTGLVDDVAIGGRPERGYGGFAIRAQPGQEQRIVPHTDPENAKPRRAWIDYSAVFPGGSQRVGITLLEHPTNPDYPSELQAYANLNCVMSAFPGAREVPLPKGETVVLEYRIWIHSGAAGEKILGEVWDGYAGSPQIMVRQE
jgi:hypothetical protein